MPKRGHPNNSTEFDEPVRLDKWVWAARFCKTRSIAREMIMAGKITYNEQRSKPSRTVELGAKVKIPAGYDVMTVVIEKILDKRQAAPLAQEMYDETQESSELRTRNAEARKLSAFHSPRPDNKPDKKQRRQIIQLKHQ
jgi:ribosome-associated heat shock protein Hsp15